VVQGDGRIVVAGHWALSDRSGPIEEGLALARYLPDGHLDQSFGNGGKVTGPTLAADAAVQRDGKVVIVGLPFNEFGPASVVLARYEPNGSVDPSFGKDGEVKTGFQGRWWSALAVALQADGKIVVAGPRRPGSGWALVRYLPDGRLDPGFGAGGLVLTDFGPGREDVYALAIQRDERIVAAGGARGGPAVARYLPNGRLDPSFGRGGKVSANFGSSDAVAIQPDGKIVLVGGAGDGGAGFALIRYRPNGLLDPGFGHSGKVSTGFPGEWDDARAVAIQSDGRIIATGEWDGLEAGSFAIARYLPDGRLDPSFGTTRRR
jgi:uncharacterized delta-60 repeat protein